MSQDGLINASQSVGFWAEAWVRFRHQRLAMAALTFVGLLTLIAIFSPAIVGTKPIVCNYKGHYYFPEAVCQTNFVWQCHI